MRGVERHLEGVVCRSHYEVPTEVLCIILGPVDSVAQMNYNVCVMSL